MTDTHDAERVRATSILADALRRTGEPALFACASELDANGTLHRSAILASLISPDVRRRLTLDYRAVLGRAVTLYDGGMYSVASEAIVAFLRSPLVADTPAEAAKPLDVFVALEALRVAREGRAVRLDVIPAPADVDEAAAVVVLWLDGKKMTAGFGPTVSRAFANLVDAERRALAEKVEDLAERAEQLKAELAVTRRGVEALDALPA